MLYAISVIALSCAQAPPPQVIRPGGGFSGRVITVNQGEIQIQGIEAEFRGVVNCVTGRGCITYFGKPVTLITPAKTVTGARVIGNREGYTVISPTGAEVAIRECDQPARTFVFSAQLAAGGYPKGLSPADSYRVQDVKVGDGIAIRYDWLADKQVCTQLRIFERPGGRVPPSPNDPGDAQGIKFHERQNAVNDWADKGIPIPDRFLSPREIKARRSQQAPAPYMPTQRIPKETP